MNAKEEAGSNYFICRPAVGEIGSMIFTSFSNIYVVTADRLIECAKK